SLPIPVVIGPERARVVAARQEEVQILAIGHFVAVDFKSWDIYSRGFVFVVPAEISITALLSESGCTGGDLDHAGLERWNRQGGWLFLHDLSVERQLMQHVSQGFGMHQAMLDGDIQEGSERKLHRACVRRGFV